MNQLEPQSAARLKISKATLPSVSKPRTNRKPHGPAKAASPAGVLAGQRLQRVLTGMVKQVENDLRRIADYPEGGIHSLRRRMKKLRPILALVRGQFPLQTREQIKRYIRLLKGSFAGWRDADVIQRLAADFGFPEQAVAVPQFVRSRRVAVTALHLRAASRLQKLVCSQPLDMVTWETVASEFQRCLKKERRAWLAAVDDPSSELLHAWRTATKAHYHQMLLVHRLTGRMKRRLQLAGSLGRWLGWHRDLEMLASLLTPVTDKRCRRALKEIGRRQRKLRRRIFRTADRLHDKAPARTTKRLAEHLARAG